MKGLSGCLITLFLGLIVGPIWAGYVLSVLWGWFLVPLHLPAVTVAEAIGISLTIGMLTSKIPEPQQEEEDNREKTIRVLSYAVLYPSLVLFCGSIVHAFM